MPLSFRPLLFATLASGAMAACYAQEDAEHVERLPPEVLDVLPPSFPG